MNESPKIPQVINIEKLFTIFKLHSDFMKLRAGGQVSTGILGQMVGLIMNDDTTSYNSVAVVTPKPTTPPLPYTTFLILGERIGLTRVRLYDRGITIDQLNITPMNIEEAMKDPEKEVMKDPEDWVYYTIENYAVRQAAKLLSVCYPQRAFKFIYGTNYFKEPCTNRKIFISSLPSDPTQIDAFVMVKDRHASPARQAIKVEYLWSDGNIYALEYTINKPFKPSLIKIEDSML